MSKQTPPKKEISEVLRHPMTLVLMSFVLSGLLGAIFSNWLQKQTAQAEAHAIATQNRKTAVQNLSRYIYERRSRAEMLTSSFLRRAPAEEITYRKKLYDEAYVKWNTNHQANLFLVREVLRAEDYSYFESVVEFNLVSKIFSPLDSCLTQAYDASARGEDAVSIVNECKARNYLKLALDCGYAITDELYKLSGSKVDRKAAESELERTCPQ